MPSDGKMRCGCGYVQDEGKIRDRKSKKKDIEVVDKKKVEGGAFPVTDAQCEKCKCRKAYFWTKQTRGADEPETKFYRCVECGHTWREY